MDSIILMRGIERLLIQCGAIALVVFGLLLYKWGVSGKASLVVEKEGIRFRLLNGTPGLFFALFGFGILVVGMRSQLAFEEKYTKSIAAADSVAIVERGGVETQSKFVYANEESNPCKLVAQLRGIQKEEVNELPREELARILIGYSEAAEKVQCK